MTAIEQRPVTEDCQPVPSPPLAPVRLATRAAVRLVGLDGLRGVAVTAVVLFHLNPGLLPGGFLGVDVFFVISGFLITRLLLVEVAQTGRIRLTRFYARRARRLFPAMATLLAAVCAAGTWIWPDQLATLRASVLASLGYVTNWWLIFDHQSYFVSSGRPPMLQHLWSLAIEEQYYLIWSAALVLLTVGVRWSHEQRGGDGRLRLVTVVALLLAVSSSVAMAIIAIRHTVPYVSDSSRVYFGTDTHGMGLLLGSAAGAWSVLWSRRPVSGAARATWPTDLASLLVLAALAWQFSQLTEYAPWLYRGGFLAVDTLVVLVVCAVVRGGSRLGRVLDTGILRALGQRSYSIYLWHWPVIVVTRPGLDVHGPAFMIDVLRIGLILALAEVSYRLVELPLRSAGWRRSLGSVAPSEWQRLLRRVTRRPTFRQVTTVGTTGLACVGVLILSAAALTTVGVGGAGAQPEKAADLAVQSPTSPLLERQTPANQGHAPRSAPEVPAAGPRAVAAHAATGHGRARRGPSVRTVPPAPAVPAVSAFGDSVLLGASDALAKAFPHLSVDAVEGRQAYLVLDDVVSRHDAGQLAPVVLLHTGNNGIINPSQLSSTLRALRDRARVIVLTDRVPRDWQAPNNETIRRVAGRFPNVSLLDWNVVSAAHPNWFYRDGLHLVPAGAAGYAQLILSAATR